MYVPAPVNTVLPRVESFDGRLAYVGLPDQVASLRQLQRLGHQGALKVDYVLGPYVGTVMYIGAIESYLRANGIGGLGEIAELRPADRSRVVDGSLSGGTNADNRETQRGQAGNHQPG